MMDKAVIVDMLRNYRTNLGRRKFLEARVQQLENWLARNRDKEIEGIALHAQNLDGMPHGTGVGRPVENLGIKLADETLRLCNVNADDINRLRDQLAECNDAIDCVEAWLYGLDARGKWLIRYRYIYGLTWQQVAREYKGECGEAYSISALRKATEVALAKVIEMADY